MIIQILNKSSYRNLYLMLNLMGLEQMRCFTFCLLIDCFEFFNVQVEQKDLLELGQEDQSQVIITVLDGQAVYYGGQILSVQLLYIGRM